MTDAEARAKAMDAVMDVFGRHGVSAQKPGVDTALVEIILSATRPAPGYIRTSQGPDMRLLGALPVTADGCVMGDWASVFVRIGEYTTGVGPVRSFAYVWTPVDGGRNERRGYPASECFSSSTAAKHAALAESHGRLVEALTEVLMTNEWKGPCTKLGTPTCQYCGALDVGVVPEHKDNCIIKKTYAAIAHARTLEPRP